MLFKIVKTFNWKLLITNFIKKYNRVSIFQNKTLNLDCYFLNSIEKVKQMF